MKTTILGAALLLSSCATNIPTEMQYANRIMGNVPTMDHTHFALMKLTLEKEDLRGKGTMASRIYDNCGDYSKYVYSVGLWTYTYTLYRFLVKTGKWGKWNSDKREEIDNVDSARNDHPEIFEESNEMERFVDIRDELCDF